MEGYDSFKLHEGEVGEKKEEEERERREGSVYVIMDS